MPVSFLPPTVRNREEKREEALELGKKPSDFIRNRPRLVGKGGRPSALWWGLARPHALPYIAG
jgi:hypothetical protein